MKIYPSLISAKNLLNLEQTIAEFDPLCHGYHIDVMDDHFVPNLTWGPAFVHALIARTRLPVHVHLMVDNPLQWVDRLNLRHNDVFLFHYEACSSMDTIQELLLKLKAKSIHSGIALNPSTPVNVLDTFIEKLDSVLLMSVQPGFSGQPFRQDVVQKIPLLASLRQEKNVSFTLGIDGGITAYNIPILRDLGIDYAGVASAIFEQPDPIKAVRELLRLC